MERRMSMLRTMSLLIAALVFAPTAPVSAAGGGADDSAPVVLELFTSQGCSSCPPADRLLSELVRDGSAGKVIPLGFHVDYWNHLGWSDPFSSARWSKRQQGYAHALSGDRLASPQLVINGRGECIGSKRDEVLSKIAAARAQPPAAAVELALDAPGRAGAGSRLRVKATVRVLQPTARKLDLWVALTQSGLATHVKGGENASAILRDDFVVRRFEKALTVRGQAGAQGEKVLDLDLDASWPLADLAVTAFAQDPDSLAVVGAAALPVVGPAAR
jgi:hypothetical protein